MPDHTHIPAVTPERYDVMNLAPEFKNGMDAFVALGAIAQATTTLQIGTAVLLVTERDPIITAKEVASVDVLSCGRMNFGVGPGWINQEMRNHAEFKKTARKPGSDQPILVTLFGGDLDDIDAYAAAGVDRVLFWVRPQDTV
jgi:alkanesulfonate monooxygenase SsuD/methylene tetrahydromethanopterin reductase-like flavin-dependent oxidoreductase (luciferase family)